LRRHVEIAYWYEAVQTLTTEDHIRLEKLVTQAWKKLRGTPIRIPHNEHREFHLSIYRRLENPFVLGILEGYWDAYEAIGLSLYTEIKYLEDVWNYHERMVEAILNGDHEAGYQVLTQHADLLHNLMDQEK
jgi:DNA-binding GntR family transcriptional regulator